jgi:hypothetical protein
MEWAILAAWSDELQKIAGRKVPKALMRKAMMHWEPSGATRILSKGSLKKVRQFYRDASRSTVGEVPLAQRLENYKHWKRTGRVQRAELDWEKGKGHYERRFRKFSPQSEYEIRRKGPHTPFTSGGVESGLRAAQKRPSTMIDHPYLVPGQTRPTTKGMYVWDERLSPKERQQFAERFSTRSSGLDEGGTPAVLSGKAPRKWFARHRQRFQGKLQPPAEAVISGNLVGRKGIPGKIRVLPQKSKNNPFLPGA